MCIRTRFLNPGLLDFLRKLFKKNQKSLGRFKYRFIKLYMLIGSDSVHYVIKWITKGWGNAGGTQAVRGGS